MTSEAVCRCFVWKSLKKEKNMTVFFYSAFHFTFVYMLGLRVLWTLIGYGHVVKRCQTKGIKVRFCVTQIQQ